MEWRGEESSISRAAQVSSLNFDEAGSSVAVGFPGGFKVFRCGPFAKIFEARGPRTALLALSTPLALVARLEAPASAGAAVISRRVQGRLVHLHSLATSTVIETLAFPNGVLNLQILGEILLVVLEHQIHLCHIKACPSNKIEVLPTAPNPRGLMARTRNGNTIRIAYPSLLNSNGNGSIAVTEITCSESSSRPFHLRTVHTIPQPIHQVTVLEFSPDATFLMVALGSAKGVQLIDLDHHRTANVFWRGFSPPAEVAALAMPHDDTLLCVTAESGTAYIHDVTKVVRSEDESSPKNGAKPSAASEFVSQLKEFVHPRAFASFEIPKRQTPNGDQMRFSGHVIRWLDSNVIMAATFDGRLYHWEVAAGESKLKEAYSLTEDYVWLLGRRYDLWVLPVEVPSGSFDDREALFSRLQSLLRFTYRSDFAPISKNKTTDALWGCMLRTGQMMLAQAFRMHYGMDNSSPRMGSPREFTDTIDWDTRIASWFCDTPESPYSVHHIAQSGERKGKPVGNWFSPTLIATVLQELVEQNLHLHDNCFRVYVADTATLYFNQIEKLCTDDHFPPLLLLIPVMLGASPLANPIYFDPLLQFFHLPEFLGVVGGKPNSSYYFIGYQIDVSCRLVYLDPHVTIHPALTNITPQSRDTLREYNKLTMPLSDLDPSLVLGFYCKDRDSLEALITKTQEIQDRRGMPIFTWQPYDGDQHPSLGPCRSGSDLEWRLVDGQPSYERSPASNVQPDSDEEWEQIDR